MVAKRTPLKIMTPRPQAQAGFSLIEVLCAVLILGVGISGLTVGMTTALRSSQESEWQTAAAFIAAGRIETMRAEGYVIEGDDEGECGPDLSQFEWKQSITETAVEGLYDVKVTVLRAQTGQSIYALQTLLFDPPIYSVPYETEEEDAETGSGAGRNQGGAR